MGRLTYKNDNGTFGLNNYDITKVPPELYGAICKLKDYEETGLEPYQIEQLDALYLEKCEEINKAKEKLDGIIGLLEKNCEVNKERKNQI